MSKVILSKDVPQLGRAGEIKEIKDGYFRNFLRPRGLADLATPAKIKEIESKKHQREEELLNLKTETLAALEKLVQAQVIFELKATPEGHLYKGVGERDIAVKLQALGFKTIRKEWISTKNPLKETGHFEVEIKTPFKEGVKVKIEIRPKN
ncbi:MAG: 50S ribosomal protein L9 [bacterium]|nr:50S ribosomal protein L9 [bacterium]